jgi:hypothetical protein
MGLMARVPKMGALLLLVGAALAVPSAAQTSQEIHFSSGPGTGKPPHSLGGFPITRFAADDSPLSSRPTTKAIDGPTGTIDLDRDVAHRRVGGGGGWSTWSNGYHGDVYFDPGTKLTLHVPSSTLAFFLYVEPNHNGGHAITVTAKTASVNLPGSATSGRRVVQGQRGARFFGFYATPQAGIGTVTIAASRGAGGFAFGELGISDCDPSQPFPCS